MLWILFGSFILLCVLRVPVAFAMLISSTFAIWVQNDVPLTIVTQRLWVGLNNFPLLAVPFFLFVGQMMNEARISHRLIDFSQSLVGHLRGGLAHVNVVVSMIFAGISGVSSADTMGIGSVMIPAMKREGYPSGFSVAVTAASSTLGNVIPPSLMMIIYAASAGVSIGAMFLAGIVPGILLGLGQMLWSYRVARKLDVPVNGRFSLCEVASQGRRAFMALVIPAIIIGGIVGGVFTATEASVVAALYVFLLAIGYRRLRIVNFYNVMADSVSLFSLSLFCVAAASLWGWILAYYDVPQAVVASMRDAGLLASQANVFVFVILTFLVIGTFMDAIPAIIILQPIMGEIATTAGIDPYHMGIVIVLTLAIGLITPPYGLCLLIAADLGRLSTVRAMRALLPFYAISLGVVILAAAWPELMLAIPKLVMPQFMR
ncbi:MAG TPA: TRAP transporter large permease [Hyphomicrobiales bacterium]|nr:TRAP transporter large permease [Hyphomicrobiales bacterium]